MPKTRRLGKARMAGRCLKLKAAVALEPTGMLSEMRNSFTLPRDFVMTLPVLSAAKWLAEQSAWTLSNLELQKILYIAHMYYLGRTRGTPLVAGHFEAWDYGPVHPDLYHKVKVFGADPVEDIFHGIGSPPEGPERTIIEEAYKKLGSVGPGLLVAATHRTGGAWHRNYVPGRRHSAIPNDHILAEYDALNDRGR